jgi:hypothetical protein
VAAPLDAEDARRNAAVVELAGRALLRRVATALATERIVPVVLKGVLLSSLASEWGGVPRPMVDVDLLVASAERRGAERILSNLGLRRWARTRIATSFHDAATDLGLDLHVDLAEPGLFRLDASGVIARSSIDTARYGVAVRVPHPHDLYAHLIAHFVRARSDARDGRHLDDFAIVARARAMSPELLASHLEATGVARAARYVLPLAVARGDAFAASVVGALPRDPVGDLLAAVVAPFVAAIPEGSRLGVPAEHALNESLTRGARSFTRHALDAAMRQLASVVPRR